MAELAPAAPWRQTPAGRWRGLGLGVNLGVGGDFDVEVIHPFLPDKSHQIAGVVEFTACTITTGQVTAQGHQAFHPHGFERRQLLAHGGSRVAPMHEKCEAALMPSAKMSRTVLKVPSWVEPPAPKVTEQNSGFRAYSCWRTTRSFSTPFGVLGGKNS
jgi:hypothetical protein